MGKVVGGVYQSGFGEAKKTEPNPNKFFIGSSGTKARAPLPGGGTAVTFGSTESGQLGQAETIVVQSQAQKDTNAALSIAERKAKAEANVPIFTERTLYAQTHSFEETPIQSFRYGKGEASQELLGKTKGYESPPLYSDNQLIEGTGKSYFAGKDKYYQESNIIQFGREASGERARASALVSKPIIEMGTYRDFAKEAPFALQQALAEDKGFLPDIIGSKILKAPENILNLKPAINVKQSWGEFRTSSQFTSQNLLGKLELSAGFGFGRAYEAITTKPASTLGNLAPFALLGMATGGLSPVLRTGASILTVTGIGAYKEVKEPGSVLSGYGALSTLIEFGTFAIPIKGASLGFGKLKTYELKLRTAAYQRAVEDTVIIKIPSKRTFEYSKGFEPSKTEISINTEQSTESIGSTRQASVLMSETKTPTIQQTHSISTLNFLNVLSKNNPFKTMGTAAGGTSLIGENFLSSKLKFLSGDSSRGLGGSLKSISDIFSGQKRKAQIQAQQQKEIYKGFDFDAGVRLKQETKQKTKQKQKQLLFPKMDVGTGQKLSLGLRQKQTSILKQEQISVQMPKLLQGQMPMQKQVQKQNQFQRQIQVQSQVQRQIQKQKQKQFQIQEQMQITVPRNDKGSIFPNLKRGSTHKILARPSFISSKFTPRYTPNLEATIFGGKRTRTPKFFTGLEFRGL